MAKFTRLFDLHANSSIFSESQGLDGVKILFRLMRRREVYILENAHPKTWGDVSYTEDGSDYGDYSLFYRKVFFDLDAFENRALKKSLYGRYSGPSYLLEHTIEFAKELNGCPAPDKEAADATVNKYDRDAIFCFNVEKLREISKDSLKYDIAALWMHEIAHVNGFGDDDANLVQETFSKLVRNGSFFAPNNNISNKSFFPLSTNGSFGKFYNRIRFADDPNELSYRIRGMEVPSPVDERRAFALQLERINLLIAEVENSYAAELFCNFLPGGFQKRRYLEEAYELQAQLTKLINFYDKVFINTGIFFNLDDPTSFGWHDPDNLRDPLPDNTTYWHINRDGTKDYTRLNTKLIYSQVPSVDDLEDLYKASMGECK